MSKPKAMWPQIVAFSIGPAIGLLLTRAFPVGTPGGNVLYVISGISTIGIIWFFARAWRAKRRSGQ